MAKTLKLVDDFCPEAREHLSEKYYVYALVDPDVDANDPRHYFYVGKGKGNRCFSHANEQLKWVKGEPNPKLEQIAQIRRRTGHRPPIEVVAYDLSENEAFRLESILIKLLETDGNLVSGQRAEDYWLSAEAIDARFAAPLQENDLGARVLLVSLNGGSHSDPWPQIKEQTLDERVLGDWVVSAMNATSIAYVVGVYKQLVRCVYHVEADKNGKSFKRQRTEIGTWRCRFSGTRDRDKESSWSLRTIIDAHGKLLTKFPPRKGCIVIGH